MLDGREEVLTDRPLPRQKSNEFTFTRVSQVEVDACKCCHTVALVAVEVIAAQVVVLEVAVAVALVVQAVMLEDRRVHTRTLHKQRPSGSAASESEVRRVPHVPLRCPRPGTARLLHGGCS